MIVEKGRERFRVNDMHHPESGGLMGMLRKGWTKGLDQFLIDADFDPNGITAGGAVLGLAASYLVSEGKFPEARIATILTLIADASDGYFAKKNGGARITHFGKFLDSSIDRIVDTAILTGMSMYAEKQGWQDIARIAKRLRKESLAVSALRLFGDKYGISMPELSPGTRVPRVLVLAACVFRPEEKFWRGALTSLEAATGFTIVERTARLVLSKSKKEKAEEESFDWPNIIGDTLKFFIEREMVERLQSGDPDTAALIADIHEIVSYIEGKAALIRGERNPISLWETTKHLVPYAAAGAAVRAGKVIFDREAKEDVIRKTNKIVGIAMIALALGRIGISIYDMWRREKT